MKSQSLKNPSVLVKEAVTTSRDELTNPKEDIKDARENNFGRKLFEAFRQNMVLHSNENKEMKALETVIAEKDKQLKEASEKLEASETEVTAQQAKLKQVNESIQRKENPNGMMKPVPINKRTL